MKQIQFSFFFVIALSSVNVKAQNSKLTTEKEPSWVTISQIDYNNKKLAADAEDGYFDLAFEKQVSLAEHARYYKKTIKILSDAGVQNGSEISINFDPGYERLILHSIRIIRDGISINKMQLSKFKIIQQEKELERHLYDGSLTALLVIDDVRKGDIIENSYTIKGFNPIFNDKYSDTYSFNFGVPVGSLYYKLIVPSLRNISIKNGNTTIAPVKTTANGESIYEWKTTDAGALHLEAKTPGWYNPYAEVLISEYQNWNEVSTWASTLFNRNIPLSPELQKKINNIQQSNETNEARAIDALHFVQDNIRYMGIEMGINSHKPGNPNKIFNQRFGDCKDKSYLLVTMLNAMGIPANPVLINTTDKNTILSTLPSASCFDHCTVQAVIGNQMFWFDPTISFQRGNLRDISYPDYEAGLVVNDTTKSLTSIPSHEKGHTEVKEFFDIPDMSGLAHFKVVTRLTGFFADDARSDYDNNSLYQMKNKYKDFYAYYFDKIVADSLVYQNDDTTGVFTITEYYTIKDIWKTEDGIKKFPVSSYVINSVMTQPADKSRSMPFSLAYPANYSEHIEIDLPEDWSVKGFDDSIACTAFIFSAKLRSVRNHVFLDYEYESLKDNVIPDEAAIFFRKYKEARDATGFELTLNPGNTNAYDSRSKVSSFAGQSIFPKLYLLLAIAVIITFLIKRQKQSQY